MTVSVSRQDEANGANTLAANYWQLYNSENVCVYVHKRAKTLELPLHRRDSNPNPIKHSLT